ncbi:FliA/WhiG family RNA polymerase sigma factor [Polynucleobacter sp. 30F-ANTBAC]|jgi:RNA polymerase sigma factor for flagellar operon FliA|uniref:FliA/WhiG family RNA polymerase sigma factor n=1 Tax=Polynucleobacter sp. 30F-ANTBAC TaxID=2689095 RepID=UPI001C0B1143|nr:FliA/WhiG family RNA polymerase sigma factor [Polynucleobacter sp. 30F-ANTBAC]MBU3599785.1 FliA/WhiG family RNA polymerase sigma factor [Polynucleobacter sp. 30F-ANTBAC]
MRPRSANPYNSHNLDEAIKTHTPLVKKIAHHIASRLSANVEVDDLIQEGMTGLLDALQRYEPQPNLSFEVYAKTRIRGAIYDSCRKNDILPRHQRDQVTSLEKVTRSLEQKLGRPADDLEIAEAAGLSLDDYFAVIGSMVNLMPLDDLPEDMLPSDHANDPMRLISMKQIASQMEATLKNLPEKEQLIMALHYQEELSYREIAVVMQLTPGRISQLHTQAMIRIRSDLKKDLS